MAIEFISLDAGTGSPPTNPRNVTVPAGCDLMVVAIHGLFMNPLTGTFNEVALDVVHNSPGGVNPAGFVQMFYMLDPPEGEHALFFSGAGSGPGDAIRISCLFFSGVDSFQASSAVATSAANTTRTTTADGSLIVGIVQGDSGAHTAVSGATELYDDAEGSFAAYRVDATAGTYSIGATSYSAPDMVAGVFKPAAEEEPDAEIDVAAFTAGSATMAATAQVQRQASAAFAAGAATVAAEAQVQRQVSAAAFAAGAATVATSATRVREAAAAFAAGAPTVVAEAQVQRQVSAAAFVSGAATFFARAGQGVKPIGVAAFSATSATMAVTAVVHVHHEASAAFVASAATMAASAARARSAVAAFAAGAATVAAEGTVVRHLTANFSASSATMAVTVFNPNIVIPRPVTGSASVSVPFGYVRTRHPSGSASVSQPRGRVK